MMRFFNVSIARKLIAVFLMLSLMWGTMCGISFYHFYHMQSSYESLINVQASAVVKTKDMQFQASSQNYALYAYLLTIGAGGLSDTKSTSVLMVANEKLSVLIRETLELTTDDEDRRILLLIMDTNASFLKKAKEIMKVAETNRLQAEVRTQSEIMPLSNLIISYANEMSMKQQQFMNQKSTENANQAASVALFVALLSLITFIAAIAVSYWVAISMSKPITRMVEHTSAIASGNLLIELGEYQHKDEIGQLHEHFKIMTHNLHGLIERISGGATAIGNAIHHWKSGAEQTATASRYIAEVMQDVQASSIDQLHNVEVTKTSVEDVCTKIRQITEYVMQSAKQTDEMLNVSRQGGQEMGMTMIQMNKIQASVMSLQLKIQEQDMKTTRIGKITGIISNIAKQTNMLALNASIEASRSGASASGFTVIASEVRKLSIQTSESVMEINKYIDAVLIDSKDTMNSASESIEEVKYGMSAISRAEDMFSSIHNTIEQFSDMIEQIMATTVQMGEQAAQVVQYMNQIETISQVNTEKTQEVSAATEQQLASMEEILHSVEQLSLLSDHLKQTIQHFKVA